MFSVRLELNPIHTWAILFNSSDSSNRMKISSFWKEARMLLPSVKSNVISVLPTNGDYPLISEHCSDLNHQIRLINPDEIIMRVWAVYHNVHLLNRSTSCIELYLFPRFPGISRTSTLQRSYLISLRTRYIFLVAAVDLYIQVGNG